MYGWRIRRDVLLCDCSEDGDAIGRTRRDHGAAAGPATGDEIELWSLRHHLRSNFQDSTAVVDDRVSQDLHYRAVPKATPRVDRCGRGHDDVCRRIYELGYDRIPALSRGREPAESQLLAMETAQPDLEDTGALHLLFRDQVRPPERPALFHPRCF